MRHRKRFNKINIEISNICNFRCGFCPPVGRKKEHMPVELFERIIRQVAPLTDQACFHLLGEPLLHPRLPELVEISHREGVPIFLVTNGYLLKEIRTELLLHPAFRQICFSLHSFQNCFGDRGAERYLERIFEFTERALAERPELYINFRLWDLSDATSGAGPEARHHSMFRKIVDRFGTTVKPIDDVRINKSRRVKGRLYLHCDTEFLWPSLDGPIVAENGTCHGLSTHFGILVDGTVVPCCLDHNGSIALGNVRDQEISAILDAPRARMMFRGFRTGRLVEDLCRRCRYIERFEGP